MKRRVDSWLGGKRGGAAMQELERRVLCTTVNLADYLPLNTGITWHYTGTDDGNPSAYDSNVNAAVYNGVTAYGVVFATNTRFYLTLDSGGLHMEHLTSSEADVDLSGLTLLPATATLGQTQTFSGSLTFHSGGTSVGAPVSGSAEAVDIEPVTVPAGTFTALKVTFSFSTNLPAPVNDNHQETQTLWLVQGLGLVKETSEDNEGDQPSDEELRDALQAHTFLSHLYNDVLHRAVDGTSNTIFAAEVDSGIISSQQLASNIVNSTEGRTYVIEGLYQSILGRGADTNGLNYWLGVFAGGGTVEQLKAQFYGSQEYFDAHGGSNAGLVDAFYVAFLGRHAEPDGQAYWQYQLTYGADRATVALEIESSSQEGAQDIVNDAYQTYLLRGPDSGGLAYWTTQVQAGTSQTIIIIGFLGSQEYFDRA
jgi:hypothetical protein